DALVARLVDQAVAPLVAVLQARGIDNRGVLYAGLMLTPDGPKVLEYNVRFGDPETQVVLPRYDGDLADLLAQVAAGRLRTTPRFVADAAVCVVLASEGYPESPRVGDPIEGLADAAGSPHASVFHAGTRAGDTDAVLTAGGRVLGVTALGATIDLARSTAYDAVAKLGWPGMHHRTDIADSPGHTRARSRPTQEVAG
ncbi:MAG TPA: phosphoribosylglycinamide synthetase C domain-containing protein, partial [Acidimicrobiales bacterium]|nr:phosphoribosylglycinamide synthetase C domain-containing protein [Acidimicrobiales bacterium]